MSDAQAYTCTVCHWTPRLVRTGDGDYLKCGCGLTSASTSDIPNEWVVEDD